MVNYSIPYYKRQLSYWLISYERRLSNICFNKNPYSNNEKEFLIVQIIFQNYCIRTLKHNGWGEI